MYLLSAKFLTKITRIIKTQISRTHEGINLISAFGLSELYYLSYRKLWQIYLRLHYMIFAVLTVIGKVIANILA